MMPTRRSKQTRATVRPAGSTEPRPPRLQRVLASAGLGSRRSCEQLILEGRVEIDGQVVTELGTRADVETQQVRVDGQLLRPRRQAYYAVHKPVGVVSTNRDPGARLRVVDLVPDGDEMFTVGRLDKTSSGLILVTNDGELANRLAHPRYQVDKTYRVTVAGYPTQAALQTLRQGMHLAEGRVRVSDVRVKSRSKVNTVLQIVLREGRNREIRRMLAKVDHKVLQLERIAIGPLRLGDMPPGAYRPLTSDELRALRRLADKPSRPVRDRTRAGQRKRPNATKTTRVKSKATRNKARR